MYILKNNKYIALKVTIQANSHTEKFMNIAKPNPPVEARQHMLTVGRCNVNSHAQVSLLRISSLVLSLLFVTLKIRTVGIVDS